MRRRTAAGCACPQGKRDLNRDHWAIRRAREAPYRTVRVHLSRTGKGMPKVPNLHIGRRLPSLQLLVPILAAGLVLATAVAVSTTVASHQQQTGIDEAVRAVGEGDQG